jgi:hypothetical protein
MPDVPVFLDRRNKNKPVLSLEQKAAGTDADPLR